MVDEYFDESDNSTKTRININDSMMKVYIRLENVIDIYESSGYSVVDMLSEVGGLVAALYSIARVITQYFARNTLVGSLIEILFRVKLKRVYSEENSKDLFKEDTFSENKLGSNLRSKAREKTE